jgi:hypothetical protein
MTGFWMRSRDEAGGLRLAGETSLWSPSRRSGRGDADP